MKASCHISEIHPCLVPYLFMCVFRVNAFRQTGWLDFYVCSCCSMKAGFSVQMKQCETILQTVRALSKQGVAFLKYILVLFHGWINFVCVCVCVCDFVCVCFFFLRDNSFRQAGKQA